jgi:DNA (cytosine-5)-methyltransferase 1
MPEEILKEAGVSAGEIDVLEGSPPCASFSTAGNRSGDWGKVKKYSETKQRTDDLFWEFARIVDGIKPKVFVAENVSGLVKGVAKGYFKMIMKRLKECGYEVKCRVLDAQWLGVPQQRQRTIFVGVRNDLVERYDVHPCHPSPLPYRYSVRDALPWITKIVSGDPAHNKKPGSGWSRGSELDVDKPCLTVQQTEAVINGSSSTVEGDISKYAIGDEWDKVQQGTSSDKYLNLSKPHPDKPCGTITQLGGVASVASVVHPTEKRKFTIVELKRICGFPDDFKLSGTYAQQWERLGRAVPPPMMLSVARVIRTEILDKCVG